MFVRSDDSWSPNGKLIANDGGGGDQFGYRVSIGDDTIVVTALRDDDKGTDAGAAYVFADDDDEEEEDDD